jgi:glycosyltransferase involved in cell wall biosynthesis
MSTTSVSVPPARITVAIATVGAQVCDIALPIQVQGLRYDVFVQRPPDKMPTSERDDLRYIRLATTGLSNSRNSALEQCQTPLLVFADNDMQLNTDGLSALAAALEAHPYLGFAAGWRAGRMPAKGPRARRYALNKRNAGRICAPELMVRVADVRASDVAFDPHFGVGAAHPVGEDFIFVCDMLDAGLRGAAFAIVMGTHPGLSTGDDWHSPEILAARRAVLGRSFGAMAPAIRLAYVLRHRKRLGGWRGAWHFWKG